jgi:hypothetical protein
MRISAQAILLNNPEPWHIAESLDAERGSTWILSNGRGEHLAEFLDRQTAELVTACVRRVVAANQQVSIPDVVSHVDA